MDSITSAQYDASAKTITFVLSGSPANDDTISVTGTGLTDQAGNLIVATAVAKYADTFTAWVSAQ